MKIRVFIPRSNPTVDPQALVHFAMRKLRQVRNPDRREPPAVWIALALAAISADHEFYDHFKGLIASNANTPEKIFKMKDLFITGLGRFQDEYPADCSDEKEEFPFPDEGICRQVLRYAVREGKKMISSEDYGNVAVFQILMKAGLQCFSWRLAQFEDVCESLENDPQNLVRKGLEIIKVTTYVARNKN
jgi:hypothetical protein